jgi:hypothetical protein
MKTSQDSRKGSKNQVIALEPGEGNSYWVLGDLYTFKVVGEETGGSFAVVEVEVQPQNGPSYTSSRR